jgi:uroporphyrin-III C-methyltransferase
MSYLHDSRDEARINHLSRLDPPPARLIPRLTVVGAGIGDPELITVKAIHALRSADVILYDALVNESLLDYAPAVATKIYVGKRRGAKAYTQDEINERIVAYAKCCGHVVRLKGGDPFVFGRGLEEIGFAREHGLETAYIPGVSSAIAGAGSAGIAVTLRGASRSFWTLTATTDSGDLNPEIQMAAQTDATVVILMGLTKIAEIAAVFSRAGKHDLPAAIIQNASLPEQREIIGTVQDIAQKVAAGSIGSPAVIILGEVVRHRVFEETALQLAAEQARKRIDNTEFF